MSPENFRSQQQHDPPILRVQLAVFVKHGGIWETDGKRDGILVPVQPKLVICQGHHPLLVRRLHRQEAVVHDGFQVRYPCEMNEMADAPLRSLRLDVGAMQSRCRNGLCGKVADRGCWPFFNCQYPPPRRRQ